MDNSLTSSILNNTSAPINIPVSSMPNSMTGESFVNFIIAQIFNILVFRFFQDYYKEQRHR